MEKFPSLNSECFDKQIAEQLAMQKPPRILILLWFSERTLIQPFCS